MKKFAALLLALAVWTVGDSQAEAQVGYATYYQPAPVYTPVQYATFYPPAFAPPAVVLPMPVPVYQPVTHAYTRYRPFLGGTVTRYRSYYAPVYAY